MNTRIKDKICLRMGLVVLCFLIGASLLEAQTKTELGNKQTKITVESAKDALSLKIKAQNAFTTEVFAVDNPPKIIVDVMGLKLKSHKSAAVPKTKLLKGFQMAISQGKLRFVFSLNGKEAPSYSTSQDGNEFSINIGGKQDVLEIKAPMVQVDIEATASPTVTPGFLGTAGQTPTHTPESVLATEMPTMSPTPELRTEQKGCFLKAIVFDKSEGSVLKLQMNEISDFKLSKDKDFYFLSIQNCGVAGEHLLLPHYPPEGFPGVNALKASVEEDELKLRIFVARGTKLNAVRKRDEIWLRGEEAQSSRTPVS